MGLAAPVKEKSRSIEAPSRAFRPGAGNPLRKGRNYVHLSVSRAVHFLSDGEPGRR